MQQCLYLVSAFLSCFIEIRVLFLSVWRHSYALITCVKVFICLSTLASLLWWLKFSSPDHSCTCTYAAYGGGLESLSLTVFVFKMSCSSTRNLSAFGSLKIICLCYMKNICRTWDFWKYRLLKLILRLVTVLYSDAGVFWWQQGQVHPWIKWIYSWSF